jgi:hypothetical protein
VLTLKFHRVQISQKTPLNTSGEGGMPVASGCKFPNFVRDRDTMSTVELEAEYETFSC